MTSGRATEVNPQVRCHVAAGPLSTAASFSSCWLRSWDVRCVKGEVTVLYLNGGAAMCSGHTLDTLYVAHVKNLLIVSSK